MEIAELDEQINALRPWILRAGRALISFYHDDTGTFREDSTREDPSDKEIHPTATNRAFFALYEYLRFIKEEDIKAEDLQEIEEVTKGKSEKEPWVEVNDNLVEIAQKYLNRLCTDPDWVRKSRYNLVNMFTDSHVLLSVSLLRHIKLDEKVYKSKDSINISEIEKVATKEIFEKNLKSLLEERGGVVTGKEVNEREDEYDPNDRDIDDVHDFVTYHAIRAFDAYNDKWDKLDVDDENPESRKLDEQQLRERQLRERQLRQLRERIEKDVLRQLAFYFANVSSRFDPTHLAFSISLLNRFSTTDVLELTRRSVETIAKSQEADGGWPTPPYVTSKKGRSWLQMASYEVALTLIDLLLRYLYTNHDEVICDPVLRALAKAFDLVKSSYNESFVRDKKLYGWANDHTRQEGLIEAWVTAIVLIFLIHYHDALHLLRQIKVLKQYQPTLPRRQVRFKQWPDLTPSLDLRLLPLPNKEEEHSWVDWGKIYESRIYKFSDPRTHPITDPEGDEPILNSLLKKVVKTTESSWVRRPDGSFMLFYGEPGTGKTSLVRAIAEALQWPFILISPPSFLRNGLEGFEAAAAEIFDDLLKLRRVVILFDECEDFFKRRDPAQQLESRTIGAFITSGMLPRLQRLRERNWIIFVLATNSTLAALDEAATREGRFDQTIEIKHPDGGAQTKYIWDKLAKKRVGDNRISEGTIKAVEMAIRGNAHARNAHCIPFKVLDRFVDRIVEEVAPKGKEPTSEGKEPSAKCKELSTQQASKLLKDFLKEDRWFQNQSKDRTPKQVLGRLFRRSTKGNR